MMPSPNCVSGPTHLFVDEAPDGPAIHHHGLEQAVQDRVLWRHRIQLPAVREVVLAEVVADVVDAEDLVQVLDIPRLRFRLAIEAGSVRVRTYMAATNSSSRPSC